MRFPIFDLHCDTALALLGDGLNESGSLRSNCCHIDLNRASQLPGFAQCFACFTTPSMTQQYGRSPVTVFELELATILREIEKNKDLIGLAYSAGDVISNLKKGRMSAILSIEGPAGFGYDPALLEDLYKIGFRLTTLGWNESSPLAGSHITGEGLSDEGREYVREAQRLGMLVDVSHISDKAFWDIMECSEAPVIASHSNSRSICNSSRNLTDDMFRVICESGGVVGINLYANFLGDSPTLDTVADHILRFLELDNSGLHIALGADLDGCDKLPEGFAGVQDYPALEQTLIHRGVDPETVHNIFWNNALGVLQNAIRINQK